MSRNCHLSVVTEDNDVAIIMETETHSMILPMTPREARDLAGWLYKAAEILEPRGN